MRERWLTACHEAGHVVASVMRSGGTFISVTIEPTDERAGCTHTRTMQWDSDFVSYAGPWAEARAQWPADLPIDEFDDDGSEFNDYILTALINNRPDFQAYTEPAGETAVALRKSLERTYGDEIRHIDKARDETWNWELEQKWQIMLLVAQLLIDSQPVTAEVVQALIEEQT